MKYVIIGGSVASISAIEGIRSVDKTGQITLISKENHYAYGRPTISYHLMGRIERKNMLYRPVEFYTENNVNLMLGREVTKIDLKCVTLENGETIEYDKLLYATGSSAFVPYTDGLENVKYHTFMTIDDMDNLAYALGENKDKDVLVVGAGLIGLKCVEGILDRAKSITVVDMADRVLSSILDYEGAKIVENELASRGVKFVLNNTCAHLLQNEAILRSGESIHFDVLVMAIGVRANTKLLQDIGAKTNRGVIVNTYMQTSLPNIFSAGDVSEGYDSSINADRVLALLPNAAMQGKVAGINMADETRHEQHCNGVPMNAIGFFGVHVLSCGVYDGKCFGEVTSTTYKKLFVKDGYLCGFMLIGNFERCGIYTYLVRNKIDLGSVDFEMLKDEPTLLAFSKDYRKEKFTRKV